MDKELPWLADNAQLELKYKKAKRRSVIVAGRANQCPLSLEVSSRHWEMNYYNKQARRKISPGIMINAHWSGSPPSSRQSI
ncbi:hypothetical protein SE963_01100 [Escherichia coli]|nr:hypothetical protein [Escherichia coli]MDX1857539.1 hypothetical protein [Escherichia coli]